MHQNAEIGYLTDTGMKIFKTMQATAGGSGGGGGGALDAAGPLITSFLGLLPDQIDMMEVRSKVSEELKKNPYVIVSFQESDRYGGGRIMSFFLGEKSRMFHFSWCSVHVPYYDIIKECESRGEKSRIAMEK